MELSRYNISDKRRRKKPLVDVSRNTLCIKENGESLADRAKASHL